MLFQRVEDHVTERHLALAIVLRRRDLSPGEVLSNDQPTALQIDVLPAKGEQLLEPPAQIERVALSGRKELLHERPRQHDPITLHALSARLRVQHDAEVAKRPARISRHRPQVGGGLSVPKPCVSELRVSPLAGFISRHSRRTTATCGKFPDADEIRSTRSPFG
jgi:hypothetical protein